MQREINIRLNANRAKAVHTGHKFASGDKGIVFKIGVDELDITGTTAKIVFKRSNGTSVEAGITAEDGVYSYTILGNEFAVVGPVTADVKFYEGEKRISTCTFVFDVTSDTMDGIGEGTAGYSDTLEKMKKEMEEILAQMKDVMDGAEEDVEAAEKKMADLTADLEALYQEYVEAFGGTGPFNPRGPYSETESYTVRDLVTYDDASWVCYRNCTGATPSKESDCWQYFAVGAEVNLDDIIDGTTQVGNAKTLDGNSADVFAKAVDLSNYLPKSGGTIEAETAYFDVKSTTSNRVIRLLSDRVSYMGLYNVADGKWVVKVEPNGTQTFNGTASGNLPLNNGSTIPVVATGQDSVMVLKSTNGNSTVSLGFQENDTRFGWLGFLGADNPIFTKSDGVTVNTLLHTGNKPTGTYTGNGSATSRTISTGGIGEVAHISCGTNSFATLSASGYIGFNGTSVVCGTDAYFVSGKIIMSTTSALFNASGTTYTYQLL